MREPQMCREYRSSPVNENFIKHLPECKACRQVIKYRGEEYQKLLDRTEIEKWSHPLIARHQHA